MVAAESWLLAHSGASSEPLDAAQIGDDGITTQALVHDPAMVAWLEAVEHRTGEEIIGADARVHSDHFLGGGPRAPASWRQFAQECWSRISTVRGADVNVKVPLTDRASARIPGLIDSGGPARAGHARFL